MTVVIDEFEVVPAPAQQAPRPAAAPPPPPPPQAEEIQRELRHRLERLARVRAH